MIWVSDFSHLIGLFWNKRRKFARTMEIIWKGKKSINQNNKSNCNMATLFCVCLQILLTIQITFKQHWRLRLYVATTPFIIYMNESISPEHFHFIFTVHSNGSKTKSDKVTESINNIYKSTLLTQHIPLSCVVFSLSIGLLLPAIRLPSRNPIAKRKLDKVYCAFLLL